jgi:hypothetical protein
MVSGARRIADVTSPWVLVLAGFGLAGWYLQAPRETKQRIMSFAGSVLTCALGAAIAYEDVRRQFSSAAPAVPGWGSLEGVLPPGAVLGRACLPAYARPQSAVRPLRGGADRGSAGSGYRAGRG